MTPPVIDRLRWVGAWMMLAVGLRHVYVAARLHELGPIRRPPIPVMGWVTELLVFASCCAFIHRWWVQRGSDARVRRNG